MSKRKPTRARQHKSDRFALGLICVGVVFLTIWGARTYLYQRTLRLSREQTAARIQTAPPEDPLPVHISIPWNTDVAIEPVAYTGGEWQTSATRATYVLGSATPGSVGNMIIYGHNTRKILGNIRALRGGETITIQTNDGVLHHYTVSFVREVDPTETTLLGETTTETLTLYTCSGFLDSKRFVVRAVPKSP